MFCVEHCVPCCIVGAPSSAALSTSQPDTKTISKRFFSYFSCRLFFVRCYDVENLHAFFENCLTNSDVHHHHITTVLRPFFRDHPGQPVLEENFWTLWCKGRLTEADTPTIRLGATPFELTSAHCPPTPSPHIFLQAGCPS